MFKQATETLIGVLLGYAPTPQKAAQIADIYSHCPYCVSYRSAGRSVTGVYSIPPEHRWWLQWVEDAPQETLGLDNAALFFPQEVEARSPWARGEVNPELALAPCETDCRECPKYRHECEGCPATIHYLGD
jgi:hypothetical protein